MTGRRDMLAALTRAKESAGVAGVPGRRMTGPQVEAVMQAADSILETHGVEAIRDPGAWDSFWGDCVALYCNAGDSYAWTLLYETDSGRFLATSWGDWVETREAQAQAGEV